MLNITYSTKKDYSTANPPKLIKIHKIYNTILIPSNIISSKINVSDDVSFLMNKKIIRQKAAIKSGIVKIYNREYIYSHIAPGFIDRIPDEIFVQDKPIRLSKYFDPQYCAKICNGLIVLPNNYSYAFNHTNLGVLSSDNKNMMIHILSQQNKYNYFMANTNNTILGILDSTNTEPLSLLNNSNNNCYIRPLFNKNFPLGSCYIESKGVSNIRIKFGNSIFALNNNINIDYLISGKYNIVFLDDKDNPILIDKVNDRAFGKYNLEISIDKDNNSYNKISSLLESNNFGAPKKNYCNLLINLYPYKTKFELFGPDNFYQNYSNGYQKLYDIAPGTYTIKFKNRSEDITVIKNDNNYFSNK